MWQVILNNTDWGGVSICVMIGSLALFLRNWFSSSDDIYNFEKDYKNAVKKEFRGNLKIQGDNTYIGESANKKSVCIPNNAKHVFVCGTTGSGKTVALANFIKSAVDNIIIILCLLWTARAILGKDLYIR